MNNSVESQLQSAWREIATENGFRRVEAAGPLEWFAGYADNLEPTLMIRSRCEPALLRASKSLDVTKGKHSRGWTLSFRLTDPEQRTVFGEFCAMLVNCTSNVADEAAALRRVQTEYRHWGRLLQRKTLNESETKGLMGELLYILEILRAGVSPMTVLEAWLGPLGSVKDFEFADRWCEVKTITASADNVTISSLEQLDSDNVGQLVVHRIDKASPGQAGAQSLADVVQLIENMIAESPAAAALYEDRLNSAGYSHTSEAAQQTYVLIETKHYKVDESFPRLSPASVPPAVVGTKYQLNLAGIDTWML